MLSSHWLLFSLLPLFFALKSKANDQLIFRYSKCNDNLGNFTLGSVYENNLGTVLQNIYSDKEINYGFFNFSYGEEPDQVNAVALCRGDVNPEDCRDCLKTSAALLMDRCRIEKEAIGYYDLCTLRYSNDSIVSLMETETGYVYHLVDKTTVDDAFNQTLSNLLYELKSAAAEGDSRQKFAEKSVKVIDETSSSSSSSSSNDTIYGLVQCTPDLSKTECTDCLDSAFGQISFWCKERKGCLYLGPICSVKYDMAPFFQSIVNSTEPPSPAPQPSQALPPAISPKTAPANSTNTSTTSKVNFRKSSINSFNWVSPSVSPSFSTLFTLVHLSYLT